MCYYQKKQQTNRKIYKPYFLYLIMEKTTITITKETRRILAMIKAQKGFKSYDRMFLDYFAIKDDVIENEKPNSPN